MFRVTLRRESYILLSASAIDWKLRNWFQHSAWPDFQFLETDAGSNEISRSTTSIKPRHRQIFGAIKKDFFLDYSSMRTKGPNVWKVREENMWEESRTRRNLLMTLRTTPGALETKASRLKRQQPLLVTLNYAFSSRLKYVAVIFSAFLSGGKSDKKLVSKTKLNHCSKLHKFNSAFLPAPSLNLFQFANVKQNRRQQKHWLRRNRSQSKILLSFF